jgi:predicted MFS family arabinose efflux permease
VGVSNRTVSLALFSALFAAQAGLIAMAPVLAQAAADLHVSTAAAGQLRSVAGLAAGLTALVLSMGAGRVALPRQLLVASVLLALASLACAAAPSYAFLALAQIPIGVAVAGLTTAATLGAAEWVPSELRTRTLSWALIGQPAAWIAGMPLVGLVGAHNWRYGWLVLPAAAAVAAALLVPRGNATVPSPPAASGAGLVIRDRIVAAWLGSELMANAAWAGTLVYAGALFSEVHGTSGPVTGVVLAIGAVAYVAGNLTGRRLARGDEARTLVVLAVAAAVADFVFASADCGILLRALLFSAAGFVVGGRTLVSNAFALSLPPDRRRAATSLRASTMQLGYVVGSALGGAALALQGYPALGGVTAALFLGAAVTLGSAVRDRANRPVARRRRARAAADPGAARSRGGDVPGDGARRRGAAAQTGHSPA